MRLALLFLLLTLSFSAHSQRITPIRDVTFYVAPATGCANAYWTPGVAVTACGSDARGSGTMSAPFATAAKAHDTLAAGYDLQGRFKATIQLSVGNVGTSQFHAPGLLISGRLLGQGGTVPPLKFIKPGSNPPVVESLTIGKYLPYTLRGDPANTTGAMCFGHAGTAHLPCVSLSDGAALKIEGMIVNTQGYDQDCIDVFNGSYLEIANVWFGYCGYPNYFLGIGVAQSSNVIATGPITLSAAMASFMQIADGGSFLGNADGGSPLIPFVIYNNPVMTQGLFVIDHATVYAAKFAFTGTINGSKAQVLRGGALFTGTACAYGIPGTAPYVEAGSICN